MSCVSQQSISVNCLCKKGWKLAFWSRERWYCRVVPRCPADPPLCKELFWKGILDLSLSVDVLIMELKCLIKSWSEIILLFNFFFLILISNPVWPWIHFLEWLNPLVRSCPKNVGVLLSWGCVTVGSCGPLVAPQEGMAPSWAPGWGSCWAFRRDCLCCCPSLLAFSPSKAIMLFKSRSVSHPWLSNVNNGFKVIARRGKKSKHQVKQAQGWSSGRDSLGDDGPQDFFCALLSHHRLLLPSLEPYAGTERATFTSFLYRQAESGLSFRTAA